MCKYIKGIYDSQKLGENSSAICQRFNKVKILIDFKFATSLSITTGGLYVLQTYTGMWSVQNLAAD